MDEAHRKMTGLHVGHSCQRGHRCTTLAWCGWVWAPHCALLVMAS